MTKTTDHIRCFSLITAALLCSTGMAAAQQQGTYSAQPGAVSHKREVYSLSRLLQKSSDPGIEGESRAAQSGLIEIRVDGLQPQDLVSVRPKGSRVAVAAGTLPNRVDSGKLGSVAERLALGTPPPASSLEVTRRSVVFARPSVLDGTVFLDVEVPPDAEVRFISDSKVILRAKLSQPLAYRNHQIALGPQGMMGTMARAAFPESETNSESWGPFYDLSDASYVVPSSKLTLLKQARVGAASDVAIVVALRIDETGHVTQVTHLSDRTMPGLEEAVKQWEFSPYVVNGRAVRVKTVVRVPDR